MKLKRLLFGPDWRSKDADVRLRAVASGEDPELAPQLSLIAREDPDARVRLAALKRLDDPRRYLEASRDDPDPELRRQARELALRQLAGERASGLDLRQRVLLVEEIQPAGELETLARTARDAEVRGAALARVERTQVLVEAAIGDTSPALREEALARIHDPVLLQRVADATRRSDKRIYRAAMERIAQARLAAEDPEAIRAQGERLCLEAEALMRRPGGDLGAASSALRTRWQALGIDPGHPLAARFEGALGVIDGLLAPRPEPERPRAPSGQEAEAASSAEPAEPAEPAEAPQSAAATQAHCPEPAPGPAPAPRPKASRAAPPDCRRELDHLEGLLAEGHVKEARAIETLLLERRPRGDQAARFGALRARLAEMLRWQRWSMREQRARLCAEAEALIDSGIHPDALATRIRELREQWRALVTLAGEDAPEGITRRFHALCHRALKPARGYFEKREALRCEHTEAARALIREIEAALTSDQPEGLPGLRRRAGDTLRDAANLSSAERAAVVAALKRLLAQIDARLGAASAEALKRKRALLAEAEGLAGSDPAKAAREIKRLQAEWKTAGRGSRREEEPLWKRFRAACDAVFAALEGRRAEREAEADAQRRLAEALIARMEAFEGVPENDELHEMLRQWRSLEVRERALTKRFEAAEKTLERRRASARRSALRSRLDELLAEAGRRHAAAAGQAGASERAADLCVRLEFLAGSPSPESDRQRRMDYQVQRLAEKMSGGEPAGGLGEEVEQVLACWRDLDIDAATAEPYAARLRDALRALEERL
jgi:exonuclease SbcC